MCVCHTSNGQIYLVSVILIVYISFVSGVTKERSTCGFVYSNLINLPFLTSESVFLSYVGEPDRRR